VNRREADRLEKQQPSPLVVDSNLRDAPASARSVRFRRQILAIKQFLAGRRCTALVLDEHSVPDARDRRDLFVAGDSLETPFVTRRVASGFTITR
jgi:2-phospho-L-lactate transferase/gluconeogenesis factor (CofD/UPF0052 family)